MSIPSQQIGWDSKTKLMWQIAKQLERLSGVMSKVTPGSGPVSNEILTLTFDDIANADLMVSGSASSVADWNTFFDLPSFGSPFTSVTVVGNSVELKGASGITLKPYLFGNSLQGGSLLELVDTGCIISCADGVFGDYGWGPTVTGCYFLSKVHMPACSSIGAYAFGDCVALADLVLPFSKYEALGAYTFAYCELLPSAPFVNLIVAGEGCFYGCLAITSFNFPSLGAAGVSMFEDCQAATSFDLSSLVNWQDLMFAGCTSLVSTDDIVKPSIQMLPVNIFAGCTSLTTADFPDVVEIRSNAFDGCTSLSSINIPNVTGIGPAVFGSTAAAVYSFPLALGIGNGCFSDCQNATTFDLSSVVVLGDTTGDDQVFFLTTGNTITLTVPTAMMTVNAGNPDGDIVYLQANNTVTVVTV